MKLNVKGMAAACALLWGGAVLSVGIANLIKPRYGKEFLRLLDSIYPGYHARPAMTNVLVGSGYAVLDGALGGAFCAWLYNRFAPTLEAGVVQPPQELHANSGPAQSAV